jgi:YHS domain-containing protein
MIRLILIFILIAVIYQAVKALVRSAVEGYHRDGGPARLPGSEMIQDPNCRTYVVKDRAVSRRVDGVMTHFCSKHCADEYERRRRG